MSYRPQPIDTSAISLPADLEALTEKLAENSHENWASQRMKDGWNYGPSRNDEAKENPCLVPYSELPDSEKVYDRLAAMETIKAIVALGYEIHLPGLE
ncbi:MAG: RyR domain-containing protein [Fimbriimonas sp.]|nr:RyR domain-containing protein [Fimbriimonas sp.]